MAKIDIKLKKTNEEILMKIDDYLAKSISSRPSRNYLGGSVIGKECDRQLWYEFNSTGKHHEPRIERIFNMGHLIESYIIALLRHSGYKVFTDDGDGQYGFEDEEIAGHIDGVIVVDDEPYLLEIKSASDKRFNEMVKVGVQQSDPVYYVQMQVYMKYMDLKKSMFVVLNKNDSSLHVEEVSYDPMVANFFINRGKEIVRMKNEPERKYKTKAFFKCKMCKFIEDCWKE